MEEIESGLSRSKVKWIYVGEERVKTNDFPRSWLELGGHLQIVAAWEHVGKMAPIFGIRI